jgi:hypothetical protein
LHENKSAIKSSRVMRYLTFIFAEAYKKVYINDL